MCGRAAVFRIAASEVMTCSKAAIYMYASGMPRRLRREIDQLSRESNRQTIVHASCKNARRQQQENKSKFQFLGWRRDAFSLVIDLTE